MSAQAMLGLGGNIGEVKAQLADALRRLDALDGCRIVAVSRLYRTPPWGVTDQAWFNNACAAVQTTLTPEALLEACLSVERAMKRERIQRWGPRTVDIDLLTCGEEQRASQTLSLPHPRMTERAFVLLPLKDIAPDLMIAGHSVAHWASLSQTAGIEPITDSGDWWH
ncbi:2-amino-4-hydroxy-6-hydroxymethyldihydropteridine diphosphokinase [Xaviernesmea oryzae]|uniref:2-amino-4-hydroxy-6-hydroxymethyldihydropteridine pyrophosphokinase n=1 Tax=Xaviernesmea oryzae TaxID=464029 RepID=A0A1Q9B095_9HYPH|nr:2-amino-4-hydroxy-6-hydroxymethyldihydropteridine diphosphokinase [Xaviernesmea oryzae]OLP61396.1 2-amino-4-hydroxy-6-hydroxymethyldihydropteridine diphosphokinase [Xaviernesmea oryzae]SEL70852.1 2-amino-4-hydroxy-6-hydroxymethyldihydropteridinediphosphokinase [Xaviernesmea oryzae]